MLPVRVVVAATVMPVPWAIPMSPRMLLPAPVVPFAGTGMTQSGVVEPTVTLAEARLKTWTYAMAAVVFKIDQPYTCPAEPFTCCLVPVTLALNGKPSPPDVAGLIVLLTEKAVLSEAIVTRCDPVPVTPLPISVVTPLIWATLTAEFASGVTKSLLVKAGWSVAKTTRSVPADLLPLFVSVVVPANWATLVEALDGGVVVTVPLTVNVPEPAFAVTVPLTGWVTAEPSTFKAVMDAMPWTVITSADAVPAVPKAGCLAAVEAPAGRGREAADTGCVTAEPSTFKALEFWGWSVAMTTRIVPEDLFPEFVSTVVPLIWTRF